MPLSNVVLVLLIGLVLGVIASVALKSRGVVFVVNIVLGILGGCVGAFAPFILGNALSIEVNTPAYLLRALLGGFVLVLLASLFRPVKLRGAV